MNKSNLREEILDKSKVKIIQDYYKNHAHFLRPRLEELKNKLDDFLNP